MKIVHCMERTKATGAAVMASLLLVGCGLLPIVEPIGEQQPPIEGMPERIGQEIELGRGKTLGGDWRYSVYRSDAGWCTQVEHRPGGGGSACGDHLFPPGILSLTGAGSGTGIPDYLEGTASDEVATVWVEGGAGERVPTSLMSLAPAGLDGQIFIAWLPVGGDWESLVALDADGEELAREPIDPFLP